MITCIFENNNKASLRHVTVNAIVVKDNQVLLGKKKIAFDHGDNLEIYKKYLKKDSLFRFWDKD